MRGFVFLAALSFCSLQSAWAVRAIPELSGPVIDEAHLLSERESAALDAKIRSYLPKLQMQIWTVQSLEDEPIESLSIRAVEKWKLGTAKNDNGLLFLVANKEHRMRIEVGQGLEGDIPDALAGRIIRDIMRPAFKRGDYGAGLSEAAKYIYQKVSGQEVPPLNNSKRQEEDQLPPWAFLIFILVFIFFGIFGPRNRGYFAGGGGWSSGGSWSGGGGGFSGGGASGDW